MNEKVALVTGASSGMGRETVLELKRRGFIVYGGARRIERMDDLKEHGINTLYLDVTDDESMVSCVSHISITAQLKTVIDRFYAAGSTGFNFNKTALLLNSGLDHLFDAAIAQYKTMTSYWKWEDKGIISIPNMKEKGSMRDAALLADIQALWEQI